jgi:hypothetical protein
MYPLKPLFIGVLGVYICKPYLTGAIKMKYYIGKLETSIAGYEAGYTFKFQTVIDPDDYLVQVSSTFWGDPDDSSSDDSFSFFSGAVWVSPYDWQEISQVVYESLSILNQINLKHELTA